MAAGWFSVLQPRECYEQSGGVCSAHSWPGGGTLVIVLQPCSHYPHIATISLQHQQHDWHCHLLCCSRLLLQAAADAGVTKIQVWGDSYGLEG